VGRGRAEGARILNKSAHFDRVRRFAVAGSRRVQTSNIVPTVDAEKRRPIALRDVAMLRIPFYLWLPTGYSTTRDGATSGSSSHTCRS
jgi:hypothetical protein